MASPRVLVVSLGCDCRGYEIGSCRCRNGNQAMQRPLAWDLPSKKGEGRAGKK